MVRGALGCALILGLCLGGCLASVDEEAWKKDGGGAGDGPRLDGHVSRDGDGNVGGDAPADLGSGCHWRPVASGTGEDLTGVWGASPGEVWVVGQGGTILQLKGSSWVKAVSPTNKDLYDVSGTSAADVWAVGEDGTVLRYDGSQWLKVPQTVTTLSSLYGVWNTSDSDVWVAGSNGTLLHYDGVMWVKNAPPATMIFYDVWGRPAGDLRAAGYGGSIFRFDGMLWSKELSGTTYPVRRISGLAAGPVWAAGHCATSKPKDCNGVILVNKGASWTTSLKKKGERFRGLWAGSDKDVWVVGDGCCGGAGCDCATIRHYDGAGWTASPEGAQSKELYAVWGFDTCDAWAVGKDGTILHRSFVP